jgi:hypothetical protein
LLLLIFEQGALGVAVIAAIVLHAVATVVEAAALAAWGPNAGRSA